jgi:hypothetical protein
MKDLKAFSGIITIAEERVFSTFLNFRHPEETVKF